MVERAESFYSPWRVKKIVKEFAHYLAVADNGAAARGLLIPGPTPETPKVGARQKGFAGDPMAGVSIIADIRLAWKALGAETDEYRVVAWYLFLHSEDSISVGSKKPAGDVAAILDRACETMAAFLGWQPEPETLHPFHEPVRACAECGGAIADLRADARFCSSACRVRAWRGVGATATG